MLDDSTLKQLPHDVDTHTQVGSSRNWYGDKQQKHKANAKLGSKNVLNHRGGTANSKSNLKKSANNSQMQEAKFNIDPDPNQQLNYNYANGHNIQQQQQQQQQNAAAATVNSLMYSFVTFEGNKIKRETFYCIVLQQ